MLGFENQAFYFAKLYMNKNHYKHYYTNGSIDKLCSECPIGFWLGRTYKQSKETKEKIKLGVLKSLPNRKIVSHNIHGGRYHGIICESSWELCFLIYCIDHNIKIERCKDYFKYKLEGLEYNYLPDFYLPDTNTYVEIKGQNQYYDEATVYAKWFAMLKNKINYRIIGDNSDWENINTYLDYVYYTYGIRDYKSLYDGQKIKESRKHVSRTRNYIWMNKNDINTLISKDKVESYINNGWIVGRKATKKMLDSWKARIKIKDKKQKINTDAFRKGKKQMYKDENKIFVNKEEIQKYLTEGWILGTGHKQKPGHHSGGSKYRKQIH